MAGGTTDIEVHWRGGRRFEGGASGKPWAVTDGNGAEAPSPVEMLLLAAAGCIMVDVVIILEKARVGLERLAVDVAGLRREEPPRRFLDIRFTFHIAGSGLDEAKARRAIDLSLEKYCSVVHSLAKDITIAYDLVLE